MSESRRGTVPHERDEARASVAERDPVGCRACRSGGLVPVLDLGEVPAADHFPAAATAGSADEVRYPLALVVCPGCGLAQLERDETVSAEPRGVEPRALREQAADAVTRAGSAGLLRGRRTVREFGSPHGGSWLDLLRARGITEVAGPADVVLDCFGIMHERDQAAAFAERAVAVAPGGVLLLQYHSLHTIVGQGQWNALRHGHFAYYTLAVLRRLLRTVGMSVVTAWDFPLYGGTVLLAAVHGDAEPDDAVRRVLDREAGLDDPDRLRVLQDAADRQTHELREILLAEAARGSRVYAYGAASRAVALFCRAGIGRELVAGVADAAPAKHGRRMPGTDVPIIAPAELVAARPDRVLLTVPDLADEVGERFPELSGRWFTERKG